MRRRCSCWSAISTAPLLAGEQPIGEPRGDGLAFTANVPVAPGGYVPRVAVIDGAGRIGSVDHRIDAHRTAIGGSPRPTRCCCGCPRRVAARPASRSTRSRQDERLAMQIDLDGDRAQLEATEVDFEVATTPDGPPIVKTSATLANNRRGSVMAQGVSEMRMLPPGAYFARAKVRGNGGLSARSGARSRSRRPRPTTVVAGGPAQTRASSATWRRGPPLGWSRPCRLLPSITSHRRRCSAHSSTASPRAPMRLRR